MAKKLNPILVEKELRRKGLFLFSPLEFKRLFDVSSVAATFFILDHTKSGLFVKLRNGLYALASNMPSELEIANRLYHPSYISFEYALSYYNIIPEATYVVTSATPKATREFNILEKVYQYHRIKQSVFLGYQPKKIQNATVLIAEPEKALADHLYFVCLKKKPLNERLNLRSIKREKLIKYAALFKKKGLIKLVKALQ